MTAASPDRNPLFMKIGKRMRQARKMAKESNVRKLSLRLGWSAGRLSNFETGLSTPGVEETLEFCKATGSDPCWITYGVGSPRAASQQSTRYRNFISAIEKADGEGELPELIKKLNLSEDYINNIVANPFKKIPDRLVRRFEKHLNKKRGWMDEVSADASFCEPLPENMRNLLAVYSKLQREDKIKLQGMAELLLGE